MEEAERASIAPEWRLNADVDAELCRLREPLCVDVAVDYRELKLPRAHNCQTLRILVSKQRMLYCLFYVKSLQQGRRARRMGNYKVVRQNRPIRSQYSAKKRSRSSALFDMITLITTNLLGYISECFPIAFIVLFSFCSQLMFSIAP
jgi:hypothetical protein